MPETPTREHIHRTIAAHVRNTTVVRFTPPATDAGPTHSKDGDTWNLRLSPTEADIAASATLDALEKLGLIPTQAPSRGDLARQVEQMLHAAAHPEEGSDDFGWRRHRPVDGGPHLLITCVVSEMWQAMPAQATRTAISQSLARWADTLTKAGLGVAPWGRGDQHEALIVSVDQATAEEQAAIVGPRLAELNPPKGGA